MLGWPDVAVDSLVWGQALIDATTINAPAANLSVLITFVARSSCNVIRATRDPHRDCWSAWLPFALVYGNLVSSPSPLRIDLDYDGPGGMSTRTGARWFYRQFVPTFRAKP
jgi:hypothetical protein